MAGGAEVHAKEIFSRLVEKGHSVDLLCSSYPSAPREEIVDGVRVVRRGGRFNFNFVAAMTLLREFKGKGYDILVEDLNKIAFFTPLFLRMPRLVIVHHLFGSTVFREVAWPVAAYVYAWELPLKSVYHASRFEVVSESTKEDLVERGLPSENIHVVYNGLDHEIHSGGGNGGPEDPPYILYFGRLKRYKRIEIIIEAFRDIVKKVENVRLVIAGDGDHSDALEMLGESLGLGDRLTFTGRVSDAEKTRLFRGATLAMNTSEKEGWGMTNVEAQACGCPVIAADSPGLRESVVNGKTGFVVPVETGELVDRAVEILQNPQLRASLSAQALRWAARFSWDEAADRTLEILELVLEEEGG